MSLARNIYCSIVDEAASKRRLMDSANVNPDRPCSSAQLITSPVKKKHRRGSSEHVMPIKTLQRIKIDSQDVFTKKVSLLHSESKPNYIPCYKQTVFSDSPAKKDPYEISATPERPRKLVRAKAKSNLLENCVINRVQSTITPENLKDKYRRPPSSPHPGKDVICQQKNYEGMIPSVSFNSLLSSGGRLNSSSRSCTNLQKNNAGPTTPLRTPVTRANLKLRGMSTSSLKARKPVVVEWDEQSKPNMPILTGSAADIKQSAVTPVTPVNSARASGLRRRLRSSSVGSLSENLKDIEDVVTNSQLTDIVMDSQENIQLPTEMPSVCKQLPPPVTDPRKSILSSRVAQKTKRRISFDSLNVYYFKRDQGREVMPKHGDIALGMEYSHFGMRKFKVLKTKRPKINLADPEESELSEDEEQGYNYNTFYEKPQSERIRMLESAGVVIEKQKTNNLIRQSREQCGCSCRGGLCKPPTCECFRLGMKCQVDGPRENGNTFPCTCYNADLCMNEYGRDVYDFDRVTQSRRAAIQRWRDSERTGVYASPQIIKFCDDDCEVVGDSQETEICHSNLNEHNYDTTSTRSSNNTDDTLLIYRAKNLFPRSQSLLK